MRVKFGWVLMVVLGLGIVAQEVAAAPVAHDCRVASIGIQVTKVKGPEGIGSLLKLKAIPKAEDGVALIRGFCPDMPAVMWGHPGIGDPNDNEGGNGVCADPLDWQCLTLLLPDPGPGIYTVEATVVQGPLGLPGAPGGRQTVGKYRFKLR